MNRRKFLGAMGAAIAVPFVGKSAEGGNVRVGNLAGEVQFADELPRDRWIHHNITVQGEIAFDSSHVYVQTKPGVWKRITFEGL